MKKSKIIKTIIIVLILSLTVFIYFKYFFVFGEGAKTGELNYVVKKGYVFKTFEGKVIQTGFQTDKSKGIQSNEFLFSIDDDDLASELMTSHEGKEVTLHYKEYLGRLPWRGYSKYVVDKIISSRDIYPQRNAFPIEQ